MKHSSHLTRILAVVLGCLASAPAWAEPTELVVRVISRDAKFIGTSMGGVRVTVRDAKTGELLAKGVTEGGTGDTDVLMKQAQTRRDGLTTEGAAEFSATINLESPRLVEVVAVGPLMAGDNAGRVSATQWILPGKHLSGGDGWVLEMPGFYISIEGPPPELEMQSAVQPIELKADVKMMCGCPIEPGGLWDADQYEIKAQLKKDGVVVDEVAMGYAGTPSQFLGSFDVNAPGAYEAVVYAYDSNNGNTGLSTTKFKLTGE